MKKILLLAAIFCGMLSISSAYASPINLYLDGKKLELDVAPQIINGRTMVPIRAIFEVMGATVDWVAETGTAVCTKDDTTVEMTINSNIMYVNGQPVKMDVSPVIVNNRTLAPARFAAESFGAEVSWSEKKRNVVIGTKDVYAYPDYPEVPDLGRCYNLTPTSEAFRDKHKVITYHYTDLDNDDYYSYLYDNSALRLGNYQESAVTQSYTSTRVNYTKAGASQASYYVLASFGEEGGIIFEVYIPDAVGYDATQNITLYSLDGRTLSVPQHELAVYLNLGWYLDPEQTKQTMYSTDGRTILVFKNDVQAYKNVGWYESLEEAEAAASPEAQLVTLYSLDGRTLSVPQHELSIYLELGWYISPEQTKQTMYSLDGRTITIYKAEIEAYKKVGWYESQAEADMARLTAN